MSDLVGNPEDRFCRDALVVFIQKREIIGPCNEYMTMAITKFTKILIKKFGKAKKKYSENIILKTQYLLISTLINQLMNYLISFLKISNQESDEAQKGIKLGPIQLLYEPRREKTGFLHMRKQRRRSASR